jgi:1-phosphofructokinase
VTVPPDDVTVFGPHPLLSITVEAREADGDDVHVHAAGQGVWVARTAGELGAGPDLCGFVGGEVGGVLRPLLDRLPGRTSLVRTAGSSGSYVVDRRAGERRLVAQALSPPPDRHELDDLISRTCGSVAGTRLLAICNPYPADALPVGVYGDLVADAKALGAVVIVDLSTPRLDAALTGRPDLVKLNDWELAEYVYGPVGEPGELRNGIRALVDGGAGAVLVTRGERSAVAVRDGELWEITPPRFARGWREGCGDAMFGGIAAGIARGLEFDAWLRLGAAAGAAAFLRRGLGSVRAEDVEALVPAIDVRRLPGDAHTAANGAATRSPDTIADGPSHATQST